MKKTQLAVIGGSGVYQMKGAALVREHTFTTPFGDPSDAVMECDVDGKKVFFLPRHGRGHRFLPSEVNYRANIYALKLLGVTHVLAVNAVGIMIESIRPGDLVVPHQIFDRTKGQRASTFLGQGVAGHVMFADPFCPEMLALAEEACKKANVKHHVGGTYVCMEGPQFSTRAESHFYRDTLKPSVIGMTAIPEAKLAREAELSYGMVALATDYDCWHETEEDVSVEAVLEVMRGNTEKANAVVRTLVGMMPETSTAASLCAAKYAIMTDVSIIPRATRDRLSLLYPRLL